MEIIRNLTRRKLRNFLTISGIVIGVLALVTMGSMAEKFNALLAGGANYFGSQIQVSDDTSAGAFGGGGFIPTSKAQEIEALPGVVAAFPGIQLTAKPGQASVVVLGLPDYIASSDPRASQYAKFKTTLASGHELTTDARGEVVLGSDIATEFKKKVGDAFDLPVRPKDAKPDFVNHTFTVVGILNKTLTGPDTGAFVSLTDAQTMMKDSLPVAIRDQIDTTRLANGITVYGNSGVDLDKLADTITAQVPGVKATRPSVLVNAFNSGGAVFTAITTGAALLALIVGGLSVINTMLMAVTERVREIGLKKAVGARVGHILREYLLEAVMIGGIGGGVGLLLGWGLTSLINLALASQNINLFMVSLRLVIVALAFSVGLGAVAGIIPAMRAARMDPVRALRSQ